MSMGIKDTLRNQRLANCSIDDKFNKSLVSYETSSDSENDSQWDFNFLDSDFDEFLEGKRLTTLVRRSYLRHLHLTLSENYKSWLRTSSLGNPDSCSPTAIAICATEMEKKALRACMMANIYQKAMVQLVREVRKSTKHAQLHSELNQQMDDSKKRWSNKESQTENPTRETSLRSPTINKTGATVGNINKIAGVAASCQAKETIAKVPPLQKNSILNAVRPLLEVKSEPLNAEPLSCPPVVDVPCEEPTPVAEPERKNKYPFTIKRKSVGSKEISGSSTTKAKKVCKGKVDPPAAAGGKPVKENLDQRLRKLSSLFGDSEASQDEVPEAPLPEAPPPAAAANNSTNEEWDYARMKLPVFNWHLELIAQVCNINDILFNMSPERRSRLEKRFKDLFGGENDPVTSITMSEITYCRKRIAEMVVSELTPLYVACRIGSKHVFKQLAKKITNSILNKTYAPDFNEVKKHVDSIFQNGKCITNLNDLAVS